MHKLHLLPWCSHWGSFVPLCMSRCPFGTYSPSHFLQPSNSEVLLVFPSASVIMCKRGCDTKVTLLSPRMGLLHLTCTHNSDAPPAHLNPLAWVWEPRTAALMTGSIVSLSPRASRAEKCVTLQCHWHINPIQIVTLKDLATRLMADCFWDTQSFPFIVIQKVSAERERTRTVNWNQDFLHDSSFQ